MQIMKLNSIPTLVFATVALSSVALLLAAPSGTGETPATPLQPARGTMQGGMQQGGMMNGMGMRDGRGMMGNMMRMYGMTPAMLNQGRMMMHATLARDDPATLLGLTTQLNLTADQVAKLQAIAASAQGKARAVLTDVQRTELDALPTMSGSMAQLYGQMMAHRQQMRGRTRATWRGPMSMMMGMPMMNLTPAQTQKQ